MVLIYGALFPALDGIVAEGHVVGVIAVIPLGVAVHEEDVLAAGMNLPKFERGAVEGAADAILGVIVLVRIQGVKVSAILAGGDVGDAAGVAGEDVGGRKTDGIVLERGNYWRFANRRRGSR